MRPHALGLRTGNAGIAARANQTARELANPGHDRNNQAANVRGRVAPALAEADEAAAHILKLVENVVEIAARASLSPR